MSHACHRFWKCDEILTFCSLLTRCTIPCACHAKRALNVQTWSEHGVLLTFWPRNVLRVKNGVHFFDISTPKSGPSLVCFVHFDWKCASHHNGVQFFISHLANWLRTRRFSEPTFWPSGATNQWKEHNVLRLSYLFRTWIFFLLRLYLFWSSFVIGHLAGHARHISETRGRQHRRQRITCRQVNWNLNHKSTQWEASHRFDLLSSSLLFSSLTLPISAFHLSILSEVWLLNFLQFWMNLYVFSCIFRHLYY